MSADRVVHVAKRLTNTLANPAPAAPFAKVDEGQLTVQKYLVRIFQQATKQKRMVNHQGWNGSSTSAL